MQLSHTLFAFKSRKFIAVPVVILVSEPGGHVLARLFVSLALQQLLMCVGRHLGGMVPSGKFLIVMVDAEFGVELEEVEALLLAASVLSRQIAPQGLPVAVEAHEV